MQQPSQLKAKLIVILGVLGVSFSSPLVRFASASSSVLVFYRIGLAALIMTLPGIQSLKAEWSEVKPTDLICCLISGIFLGLHFDAYFTSVKLTSITSATILVNTEVFFVALTMLLFFHEKIRLQGWIGILLAFVGGAIIALGDSGSAGGTVVGDLWSLLSGVYVSVYTIMGKICRKHMSTNSYTMIVYWICALTALTLLIFRGIPVFVVGANDLAAAFGMTVLCTLLGHSIFSWGLKYVNSAYVSSAKLLGPVFASTWAILFYTEFPGVTAIIGGLIVLGGVYLTGRSM